MFALAVGAPLSNFLPSGSFSRTSNISSSTCAFDIARRCRCQPSPSDRLMFLMLSEPNSKVLECSRACKGGCLLPELRKRAKVMAMAVFSDACTVC